MITITLLKKEINLPESVNELSWGTYKKTIDKEKELGHGLDPWEFFALLTGLDLKELRKLDGNDGLIEVVLWINKYIYKEIGTIKTPDQKDFSKIIFDGNEYKVPSQLEWKETGQMQDALSVANNINDNTDNQTFCQVIERLFMIYFYPIVFQVEYEVEKIHKLDVNLARAVDVRTFGDFFLSKLIGYSLGIKKSVRLADLLEKSQWQGLTKSAPIINSTSRSKHWLKTTLSKLKK